MANTTISPNMNMPIPVVSTDPGPDWANNINASLNIIDGHTHASGQGVQITPDGIDINANFPMNGNNITTVRTARFTSQSAVLSDPSDVGCLYEVSDDLYYNDGAGNQVRITESGTVTGSTGTITGLPSGTASASYSAGTFTFNSATNTPATMAVGPLVMGAAIASPKTVTLSASSSQPSNYVLVWPLAAPAANQILLSDGSGNLSWVSAGEVIIVNRTYASKITIASQSGTSATNVTASTLNLTAGDWLVSGAVSFSGNTNSFDSVLIGVSSTTGLGSATIGGTTYYCNPDSVGQISIPAFSSSSPMSVATFVYNIPTYHISIVAPLSYNLVAQFTYGATGVHQVFGFLTATRVP